MTDRDDLATIRGELSMLPAYWRDYALQALDRLHGAVGRQCSFKRSAGDWKGEPVTYCCLRDEGHDMLHAFAWPTEMDAKVAAWDALYAEMQLQPVTPIREAIIQRMNEVLDIENGRIETVNPSTHIQE